MTEKRKAPHHAWKPGQSGNPSGKTKGTRNKATQMVLALMQGGAKEITQVIIEQAKAGDLSAARLILDRLAPPMREAPVSIDLPETNTASEITQAQGAILQLVAHGELTPGEGNVMAGILDQKRKALETQELEARITALETRGVN